MLSKIISVPFVIIGVVCFYMAMEVNDKYAYYVVPCVLILTAIYLFSPQIDWWWFQRRPPKLPGPMVKILSARLPYFQRLSPPEKTRFCNRMALYMQAKEFIPKGSEIVPPDVKGVIAASAVQVTFGMEDYLLDKFEHIIVYPHPFPSPQYQEWHASESYEEDGAILFSAEQLMNGFAQPGRFFHIGLYEFARVFLLSHPELTFPELPGDAWQKLQKISGFSKEMIVKWVGLKNVDTPAVVITHFFVFPEKFRLEWPELYERLAEILNQRP